MLKNARLIVLLVFGSLSPTVRANERAQTSSEESASRSQLFRSIIVSPDYAICNRDPWPSADDMYDSLTDFYLRKSPLASLASPGELHRTVGLRTILPVSDSRISLLGSIGRTWVEKHATYQGGTISLRKYVVHAGIGLRYCTTGCDESGRTERFSTFVEWSYGLPFLFGLSLQSPTGRKDYGESFGLFDESWSKFGGGFQYRFAGSWNVSALMTWAARGIIGGSLGMGYELGGAKNG